MLWSPTNLLLALASIMDFTDTHSATMRVVILSEQQQQQQGQTTVVIDVGYDVTFTVTVNSRSGILYQLYHDMTVINSSSTSSSSNNHNINNSKETIRLVGILRNSRLSSLISNVSITVYVAFLRNTTDNKIVDQDTLLGCLLIFSLTEDRNFFDFLLQQLFKLWTLLSTVLSEESLPTEVKQEVWRHCPHQLLPKWYRNDTVCMAAWLTEPSNKHIILNGEETFEYRIEEADVTADSNQWWTSQFSHYAECESTYQRSSDSTTVLYSSSVSDCKTGGQHIESYRTYNNRNYGLSCKCTTAKQELDTYIHINSNLYGPKLRYVDQKLVSDSYMELDDTIGTETNYYASGRIKSQTCRSGYLRTTVTEYADEFGGGSSSSSSSVEE